MDDVAVSGQALTITKHGKPIAVLNAFKHAPKPLFGADDGALELVGEVISPIEEAWDADTGANTGKATRRLL